MNILAKILSGSAETLANTGNQACAGFFWDEPVCPEEIL